MDHYGQFTYTLVEVLYDQACQTRSPGGVDGIPTNISKHGGAATAEKLLRLFFTLICEESGVQI